MVIKINNVLSKTNLDFLLSLIEHYIDPTNNTDLDEFDIVTEENEQNINEILKFFEEKYYLNKTKLENIKNLLKLRNI